MVEFSETPRPMYPAAFDYVAATSWDEAIELLSHHGDDAKVLAGGCSLIPVMKLRMAEPRVIIDLRRIVARAVTVDDGAVRIGALTRESTIETADEIALHCPILAETSAVIADPIVRNMGTIGGNIAHADPANDHPATMLALGAEVVVRGPSGERIVAIDDFFVDLFVTSLEPDELVTEVRIPRASAGSGGAYVKFERQVGDFPIVAAAAQLTVTDGTITAVRIGLTNVASTAVRARASEDALLGGPATPAAIASAAEVATTDIEPWGELRGSRAFKLQLLPVIVRRAVELAVTRAAGRAT